MAGKYWWEEDEEESQKETTNQSSTQTGKKYWWEEDTPQSTTQNTEQGGGTGYWWDDGSVGTSVGKNVTDRVNTWLQNHNNYIGNYQNRYSSRKYSYEDDYVTDSAGWLETVTKQKSNFDAEADSILSYMDQYSGYLDADWMKQVREILTQARGAQQLIVDNSSKDNEWWSSFGSEELLKEYGSPEDAYRTMQRHDGYSKKYAGKTSEELYGLIGKMDDGEEKDWLSSWASVTDRKEKSELDLNAAAMEIEDLGNLYDEAITIALWHDAYERGMEPYDSHKMEVYNRLMNEYGGDVNALRGLITKKEARLNQAKYVQKGNKLAGVGDAESEFYDPEFSQYSNYVDGGKMPLVPDYEDIVYGYINGNEDAKNAITMATAWRKLSDSERDRLEAVKHMSPEEKATYNYYYNKHGYKAAEEYLSTILEGLDSKVATEMFKPLENKWALEMVFGVTAGLDQFNSGIRNLFSTDDYIPASAVQQTSAAVRDDLGDVGFKLPEWMGGASIGQGAYDAITTTANMAPSILLSSIVGTINPVAGAAVGNLTMGASAAGNAYQEAVNQGYDKGQARAYSTLVGASEVGLQYLLGGIGKLGGTLSGKAAAGLAAKFDSAYARLAVKYGMNMLSEGAEEYLQEILTPVFKNLALKTDEEVELVTEEAIYSFLLGSLSSGFMEVTGISSDNGKGLIGNLRDMSAKNPNNIKAATKYGDVQAELIEEGLASSTDSESYQLAEMFKRKADKGKSMTGYEIRQLVEANEAQFAVEDYEEALPLARKRLRELGESDADVEKIAKLVAKRASGQKLTSGEKSTLVRSRFGSKVAKEMTPSATESVYKPLEDRVGTEGRFGVSESGKATVRATGTEFDLGKVEVTKIGEGQVTFKLEDGTEVSAGDIDFADADQSYLVSAVSDIENITPTAATAMIRDVVDTTKPIGAQLNGIDEAYTYGYYGYSETDLKAGNFTTSLTPEQMKSAYVLGQSARKNSKDIKADRFKRMRTAAQAEAEKALAEGKEAPKAKNLTISYNDGGNVVSIDEAGIKDQKRTAAVEVAKILHKLGLGTKVEFFSSYVTTDEHGNKVRVFKDDYGVEQKAYSGVYRKSDGTIRIDLNAYNGRGLALNALAHELTHFIQQWSAEKYTVLADFLIKSYEKTDMTMHERVIREQARLEGIRGEEVSYEEAFDEVVANAMSKMFDDGRLVDKLTELKAQDESLAKKLWEGLKKIVAKFLGVYKEAGPLFRDTADIMAMKDAFEQLQDMFAEAMVEASDNYQAYLFTKEAGLETVAVEDVTRYSYSSLAEAAGFVAVEVENTDGTRSRSFTRDGKKVSEVTIDDIDNSPIGAFINFSLEMGDISKADAKRQKKMFADICTMACKTNDFAMTMQFVGSAVFTGMKANADKQYGTTYDFPSICTKTQAVIDVMSAKMMSLGRGLTTDEIVQLYDDVFASGNPVPCPECYVFSRWIGIGGLLDNIKKYQDYYGDMSVADVAAEYRRMRAEVAKFAEEQGISFGKAKGALTSKLTKEFIKLSEKIQKAENQGEKVKPADRKRLAELEPMMNTVKGMTWLETVYFADSSLTKVNPDFRVPDSVLFDLNNGEEFATKYRAAWAFRTTQGAGYGKAITPYAEARLGEGVLVTNNTSNAIKGRAQGSLDNYFLRQMGKLDKQSRDALKRARLKQKIQAFLGGQRFQSTSDARYENASDYLLAALEMQAMHGMVQAYTKVDGAVPAFSAWGFSINQSLMPLNGGLDENGEVQDTPVGGMKPSVAFENRNKHETAGTITIGVNDNHIRAMFKQWVRDFIIPYHASGGKADVVAAFRRIQEGKEAKGKAVRSTDYSRTQSDKVLSDEVLRWQGKTDAQIQRIHEIRNARIAILTGGKPNMTVVRSNRFLSALYDKFNGGEWDGLKIAKSKVESQIFPNEFWDQTVTYDESAKITKDYLEYCEDLGFLHRFSGMIPSNGKLVPVWGYDENGERVQLTDLAYQYDENGNKTNEVEQFFWKVLTDRRMYDNNGNYLAQKIVTLNDTTTDTVTGFAKHNQGRQYDKEAAGRLAKEILGDRFSSQESDIDTDADSAYDGGKKETKQEDKANVRREETREAFNRRAHEKVCTVRERGEIACAYNPVTNKTRSAGQTERNLKKLGIQVIVHEGLEVNVNGITRVILGDATSVTGDAVYVRNSMKTDPMETAGHEAFHFWKHTDARAKYIDSVVDNIIFSSDAFVQFQKEIADIYFGDEVGVEDDGADKLTEEIYAYITGLIHAGDSNNIVRPFMRDYDAVKAAWDDLIKKQATKKGQKYSSQETDADNAPTFYSQMAKVVEGMKQEKFGASSVISMLRGRGVKAEEIRWSGIQAFLDGKKSVTKQELLDFINSSMLQIEEEERGETKKYSPEQQKRLNELENELNVAWDEVTDLWRREFGEDIPSELLTSSFVERRVKKIINTANAEAGTEISENGKRIIALAHQIDINNEEVETISYQTAPETQWGEYKLPGGENYREILFKMPGSTYRNQAMEGHWGDRARGILAHARIQDFVFGGKKMLFIEEIQSDWHNEGARRGYGDLEAEKARIDAEYDERLVALAKWQDKLDEYNERSQAGEYIEDYYDVYDEYMSASARVEASERLIRHMQRGIYHVAPDAPFKNNYHEYVLKRLLRMAAEEGYDSIGWTTADIQSERWSGEYAEGYRIEYDQDIPKFLRKYGKQWGATVERTGNDRNIELLRLGPSPNDVTLLVNDEAVMNFIWSDRGWYVRADGKPGVFENWDEIREFADMEYPKTDSIWKMDITPAMKDSVLTEGQAMYSSQETDLDSEGRRLTAAQNAFFKNSKVRDRNGNLLVVRHGTNAEFNIFDFTKSGKNGKAEGYGFYFSDDPEITGRYGGIQKEVYLNITKPLYSTKRTVKKVEIVKLVNALIDSNIAKYKDDGLTWQDSFISNYIYTYGFESRQRAVQEFVNQIWEYNENDQDLVFEIAQADGRTYSSSTMQEFYDVLTESIGYDGIIAEWSHADGTSNVYVTFKSEQSKYTTNATPTTDPDMRFSEHDTDYSNRSLLANAFESIANGSEEYKLIQRYKSYIAELNSLENTLSEINRQIREIRFGEGKYDAEKLKKLESEAKKIADAINKYDRYLINLEASEPLRKLIKRERKKEAEKTKAHVQEIQQNRKDRAEQTEFRRKIRKVIRDLDRVLNRGNKKLNVKEDMKGFVSKALELADYLFTDHISNDELIRRGITVRMTQREAALVKETEEILSQLYDHPETLTAEDYARLDAKRKSNMYKLRDLLTAQRNERLNTPVYNLFNDLITEYSKLKNSSQDAVKNAYNPDVERFLRFYIGEQDGQTDTDRKTLLQNMRVADMSTQELEHLLYAYNMVLHTVRNANNLWIKGKAETVEQMAGRIYKDFSSVKIPEGKVAIAARNLANKMGWDYEKLYYALDRIGSEAFTELVMNIADSENIVMQDVIEATAFRDEMVEKYGFNSWDVNKEIDRDFLDNTGKKFRLTLGQLMALYAYSRREGAWDHIEYGGFVFGETALTNPKPADSYKLSKKQCEALTDLLTKEQKGYVEEMQKFLSEVMGGKGNEVSMMLYGIKMFREKNYFPIKVAGQFKAQANESQAKAAAGFSTMSNAGFTHAQNPNAKAPFVLEGFNDIWADHVNEMSRYHGTVPALEDMRRVMNSSSYSEAGAESIAIKQLMENSFGKEAVEYFDSLYREANSGAITDKLQRIPKKLLSLFRKNSVAYSLSVIIQQPAAMVRAYAMIDRKYFGFHGVGALTSGIGKALSNKWTKKHSDAYAEMLQYAPGVTMAKEIGGFDTHTGGSIRSYLLDTGKSFKQKWKTGTVKEKGMAVLDLVDDNAIANLPNLADKIAWIEIWNACKRETVATHKDLAPNSEEFMKIVGDRFTEVIRATQVYDSMFSKSPMLKSKHIGVQYLVSFMNEPNTVANMAEKAVRDATKGDWLGGAKVAHVVIHSIIFTNMLKSIVYAIRDDDEDETYWEKYIESLVAGLMNDFSPFGYIPIARDVQSKMLGYEVERPDMAAFSDANDAWQAKVKLEGKDVENMSEEEIAELDQAVTEANWKLAESIAAFFGIPVKNIRREIEGIMDHARIAYANAGKTTKLSAWDKVYDAVVGSIPFMQNKRTKDVKLYDAIISGDRDYLDRMKSTYKDESAYQSAVRKALRENDSRIHDAALARYEGRTEEYKRIFREIQGEGKFSFDDIMSAVTSEESKIRSGIEPDKVTSAYTASDFVESIVLGDTNSAQAIKEDIIAAKVANGKTQDEAEKEFVSNVTTGIRDAYSSGLLDEAGAEKMLVEYTDMDEDKAASRVSYWSFCEDHPEYKDVISEAKLEKYYEFAEPENIPLDVYAQFVEGTKGIKTIRDSWGDVEKSVRDQTLEFIDSLPITWQQKDALYLAAGYDEDKIWDVPW